MRTKSRVAIALVLASVLLALLSLFLLRDTLRDSLRASRALAARTLPSQPGFPKVLHFVWVSAGLDPVTQQSHTGHSLPPALMANIDHCRVVNPGWDIWVWDNQHVLRESGLSRVLSVLRRVPNAAWLSDILRYYLMLTYGASRIDVSLSPPPSLSTTPPLSPHGPIPPHPHPPPPPPPPPPCPLGGVYLDADFECIRPLDLGLVHAEAAGATWLAACEFPARGFWSGRWWIPTRSPRLSKALSLRDFFLENDAQGNWPSRCGETFANTPLVSVRDSELFRDAFEAAMRNTRYALARMSKDRSLKPKLLGLTGPDFFTGIARKALKAGRDKGLIFQPRIFFPCILRFDDSHREIPCDSNDKLWAEANDAVLAMHEWRASWQKKGSWHDRGRKKENDKEKKRGGGHPAAAEMGRVGLLRDIASHAFRMNDPIERNRHRQP